MNTILIDLEGTLLPMEQRAFDDTFYKALQSRMAPLGYGNSKFMNAYWQGIKAMSINDGFKTNEECFWLTFEKNLAPNGKKLEKPAMRLLKKEFNRFYNRDFPIARFNTEPTPLAKECIDILREKGYSVVIAANPTFPETAIFQMIEWAGLSVDEFALITTYENTCYCKPNLGYYRRILQMLDKDPEDCLMVGNDVYEDMCSFKLGLDVFLIDQCLINKHNEDISEFKRGNWQSFKQYISELPYLK